MKVTSHKGLNCRRIYMLHTDEQLLDVADFLRQAMLPSKMGFGWQGQMYTFDTAQERKSFALGLEHAHRILY